jgi:molybdopterin synthase sulfur carrier subunit
MIRVVLPFHLRRLAQVGGEVALELSPGETPTLQATLDALEQRYPILLGTIRDQVTRERRPFLRFFACEQDLSLQAPHVPLPEPVARGDAPLLVVGAMAGG